jgi:hypothetical protein
LELVEFLKILPQFRRATQSFTWWSNNLSKRQALGVGAGIGFGISAPVWLPIASVLLQAGQQGAQNGFGDNAVSVVTPDTSPALLNHAVYSPRAHLITGTEATDLRTILNKVEARVQQQGTLSELIIQSHGSPGRIYLKSDQNVGIGEVLQQFTDLQNRLGKPIARRIVFGGCDIAAIDPQRPATQHTISLLQHYASALKSDITTSTTQTNGFLSGNFITVAKDGSVHPSSLIKAYDVFTTLNAHHTQRRGYQQPDLAAFNPKPIAPLPPVKSSSPNPVSTKIPTGI